MSPGISVSRIPIPFRKAGINWSSYWTPSNLRLTALNTTSASIAWDDPSEAIDGVRVYINDVLDDTIAFGVEVATITGLTADTAYTIKIIGYKDGGHSPDVTLSVRTILLPDMWMIADSIEGDDDDGVAAWVSSEGNGYSFAQADTNKQPKLKKGTNGINGHNVVRFDGSNDLLVLASAPLISDKGGLLIIYKQNNINGTYDVLFSSNAAANYFRIYGLTIGGKFGFDIIGNAIDNATPAQINGIPYCMFMRSNGTSYGFYLNEQEVIVPEGEGDGRWWGDIASRNNTVIGASRIGTTEAAFINADIAEVIAIDSEVTDAQATALYQYLSLKYKLPMEFKSEYYYANTFGGWYDGVTPVQLTAAVTKVTADGGGTIYFDEGNWKIAALITWASNISIKGAGMDKTTLALYDLAVILKTGTVLSPTENCNFDDFTIDGTNQDPEHSVGRKGFSLIHNKNCHFTNVTVQYTGATGFGVDYPIDSVLTNCKAIGCGRTGETNYPGCSGFGIGTGLSEYERIDLINCEATGNKRYGAFFEIQDSIANGHIRSKGVRIIGGKYNENNWGIGDCGVDEMLVDGAEMNTNAVNGFINGGPSLKNLEGTNGIVRNCEVAHNVGAGIVDDGDNGYTFTNNDEHDNGA